MQGYTIKSKARGMCYIIDNNGVQVPGPYMTRSLAAREVTTLRLQDRLVKNPKVLAQVLKISATSNPKDWLYQTLIRFDLWELRQLSKKPTRLNELYQAKLREMDKSFQSKKPVDLEQACRPAIDLLKAWAREGDCIIVTTEGATLFNSLETVK